MVMEVAALPHKNVISKHFPPPSPQRCVHLVGIAGHGMRAMADVLHGWGWNVRGSDRYLNGMTVASDRVHFFQGHDASHLAPDTELVIHSDAVPQDNPELCRAAELGIPAISYFDMLGRLSERYPTVAVAGTHGKSTVTAMLGHIASEAGRDPTVFCGAAPLGKNSGGRAGRGELMLIEACEYRANFLKLRPRCAAILNVEPDHFDCYDSLNAVEQAFGRFADSLPPDGFLLVNDDCDSTRRAISRAVCRIESFGLSSRADWTVRNISASEGRFAFEIVHRNNALTTIHLPIPGRHNMRNALTAAALAWHNGISAEKITLGLENFGGLHRRLEHRGVWHGVDMVTDYAHHPTEVEAALESIRLMYPRRRVWCVFQPHQASRTARLLDEFAGSLQNADRVIVAEIFRARELPPRNGEISGMDLARRAAARGVSATFLHSMEEIASFLKTHLVPGDVLVTLGAGDIGTWSMEGRP